MKRLIVFLMAVLAILSCHDEVDQKKTLDVERFTIEVPSAWALEEVQGYDSFVRQIKINEQERISIDLGQYSSNLNVDDTTHEIIITTIDDKEAKIVKPKKFQHGITGIYFDSLDIQKQNFK